MIKRASRRSGIRCPDRNPTVVRGRAVNPRAAHEAAAIVKQGIAVLGVDFFTPSRTSSHLAESGSTQTAAARCAWLKVSAVPWLARRVRLALAKMSYLRRGGFGRTECGLANEKYLSRWRGHDPSP